uniref:Uncharacterized protein n=1 Tax=Pararge aegeria TaxID=116150 RepID=S4PXI6_9NEOP
MKSIYLPLLHYAHVLLQINGRGKCSRRPVALPMVACRRLQLALPSTKYLFSARAVKSEVEVKNDDPKRIQPQTCKHTNRSTKLNINLQSNLEGRWRSIWGHSRVYPTGGNKVVILNETI